MQDISRFRFRFAALFAAPLLLAGCDGGVDTNNTTVATVANLTGEFCYDAAKLEMRTAIDHAGIGHDVLVLIDQTTTFPDALKSQIKQQVAALLGPGTRVSVGTFSAYSSSDFATTAFETRIEPAYPADKRNKAPRAGLRALDECLAERQLAQRGALDSALTKALESGRKDIKFSDVMVSIREFSKRFATAKGPTTLVLVSDMLENSSATSFYANGEFRQIDPAAELKKAAGKGMLPTLPASKVFVLGAGLIPDDAKAKYRSVEQVAALEQFWEGYFTSGGAASVSIGKPMLIGETIS